LRRELGIETKRRKRKKWSGKGGVERGRGKETQGTKRSTVLKKNLSLRRKCLA